MGFTNAILSSALIFGLFNWGCMSNNSKQIRRNVNGDTIERPIYVPKEARRIRFGSDQEPRFVWAEYIGPLKYNHQVYPHILGIRYIYAKDKTDTLYYENLELRSGQKQMNPGGYSLSAIQIDEGTITVTNGVDSLELFTVLQTNKFNNEYRGMLFTSAPSIRKVKQNNTLISDSYIEYNLKSEDDNEYILTLRNGSEIPYKLSSNCKNKPTLVSFINREDGKIFFIEQDCFMELANAKDLYKLVDER